MKIVYRRNKTMETIKTFEELEKFLNTNKGFSYYIANPLRRKFIKFDKEIIPDLNCYLIESEEQEICEDLYCAVYDRCCDLALRCDGVCSGRRRWWWL